MHAHYNRSGTRQIKFCFYFLFFTFLEEGESSFDHESPRYEDEPRERGKERKRGTFPKHATNILKSWLFQHLSVSTVVNYDMLLLARTRKNLLEKHP